MNPADWIKSPLITPSRGPTRHDGTRQVLQPDHPVPNLRGRRAVHAVERNQPLRPDHGNSSPTRNAKCSANSASFPQFPMSEPVGVRVGVERANGGENTEKSMLADSIPRTTSTQSPRWAVHPSPLFVVRSMFVAFRRVAVLSSVRMCARTCCAISAAASAACRSLRWMFFTTAPARSVSAVTTLCLAEPPARAAGWSEYQSERPTNTGVAPLP